MTTRTTRAFLAVAAAAAIGAPVALAASTTYAIKPVKATAKISGTAKVTFVKATHTLTIVIKVKGLSKGTYTLDVAGTKSAMLTSLKVTKSGTTVTATRTTTAITTWPATGETLTIGTVATSKL